MKALAYGCILVLAIGTGALAWWDTQIREQKAEPLVKAIPAHTCQGATDIRADAQTNGGKGGNAVFVKPGAALTFKLELKRSIYALWFIARAEEDKFKDWKEHAKEIETELTKQERLSAVYVTLNVKYPDGATKDYSMPVAFRDDYAVVSKLYFPFHVEGACEITAGIASASRFGLQFDRFEVRDVLGLCARKAVKEKRMLTSDEELATLRKNFAADPKNQGKVWVLGSRNLKDTWKIQARSEEERRKSADRLWASVPDWNLVNTEPAFAPWHHLIGRDCNGKFADLAGIYEQSGDPETGWEAAVLLCAMMEKYPGLDHYYQSLKGFHAIAARELRWGTSMGKSVYSGWSCGDLDRLVKSYDKIFDYVKDNQALADYVCTHIPWVKTPTQVIELLDTNLLQHGVDCLNRRIIRGDGSAALLPLVQGVNEVSKKMLEEGIFLRMHVDMVDQGGIDDQIFSTINRSGVHYIGSTGYVNSGMAEIAGFLAKYCAAGGDPKFNLADPKRFPNVHEAETTKSALFAAGGFPIVIGDAMDLSRRRDKGIPEFGSRVLEGFGAVVLEEGQGLENPLLKRAVAVRTGLGRGHAHQDALNIEVFAHGCRLAPDLGGRHEGKNRSSPNMRINRMHNLVEVDEKDFCNPISGSTTGATGWTVSFSPCPGAAYTANAARAASHPNVSLYQRETAMLDAGEASGDFYLFDVFRVHGGKVHTYCFHGGMTDVLESNANLEPAQTDLAKRVLKGRPPDSMQAGLAPDPLVATWVLKKESQSGYQTQPLFQPDRPVGISLALFGHGGEPVFAGSASSGVYPVAMPYLHLRGAQETEGRDSIFPALYEAFAGEHFITEKKRLAVKPEAKDAEGGAALAVKIGEKRRDTLFSSLQPKVEHELEDGTQVAGEFGVLSEDEQGLRLLHLVGGTRLERGGIGVTCARAAWEAEIENVDYPNQAMTLSAELPAHLLDGQVALLGNPAHWSEFQLAKAAGRQVSVVHTPKYYQSRVEYVDAANGRVQSELEPSVFGCDQLYCNGTTVTNEAQDKFWKAKVDIRERWMYLGWPGTELSYPAAMRMEELPDANGDGKHMLKLLGRGGTSEPPPVKKEDAEPKTEGEKKPANAKDGEEAEEKPILPPEKRAEIKGEVKLELEVTRVVPEEHLFYFKMPENPDYQTGGWQFANRVLVNEDGSKKWWASYPGLAFGWKLTGPEQVNDAAFPDTDGDGKRLFSAYLFGPGDHFQLKTFVYVKRMEPGLYQVRANAACVLTLPGQGGVELSADGQAFRALASRKKGAAVELSLTDGDLGTGTVWVRMAGK